MKISQNPPYEPITQLPHCCVPTCISMILERRGIPHGTQEEIGNELGLVVSPKNAHLFKEAIIKENATGEYGTQVDSDKYSLNNFFEKNEIKLEETYLPAEKVDNVKQFIEDHISAGDDLLVCINNEVLYGKGHGHASLIQAIDGDEVTLIDPGINKPKVRKVQLLKLVEAMKANKRRGGFWVISSN